MTLTRGKPMCWEKNLSQCTVSIINFIPTGLGPTPGLPGDSHDPQPCHGLGAPCMRDRPLTKPRYSQTNTVKPAHMYNLHAEFESPMEVLEMFKATRACLILGKLN